MRFYKLVVLLFGLLACASGAAAQSVHTPLRKGDRAYDRVQYKDAEKQYRIAADREIGNPQAVYNLGNCLYQQGQFEDAAQRFEQVASAASNPIQNADAFHNLGDAQLKQRKFKEAVKAYEASLRLRPGDAGTKRNLQMAKKKLREEEQKEKEKQQKEQQQKPQNQDQNQNQDPNQAPPKDPQNQEDKPQDQPQQPQQPQEGQQPQQPKEQQKQQEEQRLKKEDAKRMLETAVEADDRKNAQKYRAAQQQSKPKGPKKDW